MALVQKITEQSEYLRTIKAVAGNEISDTEYADMLQKGVDMMAAIIHNAPNCGAPPSTRVVISCVLAPLVVAMTMAATVSVCLCLCLWLVVGLCVPGCLYSLCVCDWCGCVSAPLCVYHVGGFR